MLHNFAAKNPIGQLEGRSVVCRAQKLGHLLREEISFFLMVFSCHKIYMLAIYLDSIENLI